MRPAHIALALAALVCLAVALGLAIGVPPAIALVPAVLVGGLLLAPLARWRPERITLVVGMLAVAVGLAASAVRVADAVSHRQVEFHGKLDIAEIRRTFSPPDPNDPRPSHESLGHGYLTSAEGEMRTARINASRLALWSAGELAPWILAALVLGLLIPVLRASERGDPFGTGAVRRLGGLGALLLVAIPGIAILRFIAAEAASAGNFASPGASPALSLSVLHVLPGLLVLVLARVLRQGAELRDFERHAI